MCHIAIIVVIHCPGFSGLITVTVFIYHEPRSQLDSSDLTGFTHASVVGLGLGWLLCTFWLSSIRFECWLAVSSSKMSSDGTVELFTMSSFTSIRLAWAYSQTIACFQERGEKCTKPLEA